MNALTLFDCTPNSLDFLAEGLERGSDLEMTIDQLSATKLSQNLPERWLKAVESFMGQIVDVNQRLQSIAVKINRLHVHSVFNDWRPAYNMNCFLVCDETNNPWDRVEQGILTYNLYMSMHRSSGVLVHKVSLETSSNVIISSTLYSYFL